MTTKTKTRLLRALYLTVLISFLAPIIYLCFEIALYDPESASRPKGDYVLMLVQCILGTIVIHIPSILTHKAKIDIPVPLYVLYIIFLYCAIFLGELGSFYHKVQHWDDILHGMSSVMTGFFGYMLIAILNREAKRKLHLSPFFVALFAFCFSVTIGAVWEIYEFAFDTMLGLNMQKFMDMQGAMFEGQAALFDTMKDLIVDTIGAAIATVVGLMSVHCRGWVHGYLENTVVVPLHQPKPETEDKQRKKFVKK